MDKMDRLRCFALGIFCFFDRPKETAILSENGFPPCRIGQAILSLHADCMKARENAIKDLGKHQITQAIPTMRRTLCGEYDEVIAEAIIDSLMGMKRRSIIRLISILHPAYYIRALAAEKLRQ